MVHGWGKHGTHTGAHGLYYGRFCASEAEGGGKVRGLVMKGVNVTPKVSSWMLMPVTELWRVYGDMEVSGKG